MFHQEGPSEMFVTKTEDGIHSPVHVSPLCGWDNSSGKVVLSSFGLS